MSTDINRIITDFVNFDIENDYYQNEMKDELVRSFKKILYEDESRVRQWLKELFNDASNLADEYDLIAKEGEVEEVPTDDVPEIEEPEDAIEEPEDAIEEPEDAIEEPEDAIEEPEDSTVEEKFDLRKLYINTANNILYD